MNLNKQGNVNDVLALKVTVTSKWDLWTSTEGNLVQDGTYALLALLKLDSAANICQIIAFNFVEEPLKKHAFWSLNYETGTSTNAAATYLLAVLVTWCKFGQPPAEMTEAMTFDTRH